MEHKIEISLPKGGTLAMTYTDLLVEQVRQAYKMSLDATVPESHIKAFLENELKSAIEKEEDVKNELSRT